MWSGASGTEIPHDVSDARPCTHTATRREPCFHVIFHLNTFIAHYQQLSRRVCVRRSAYRSPSPSAAASMQLHSLDMLELFQLNFQKGNLCRLFVLAKQSGEILSLLCGASPRKRSIHLCSSAFARFRPSLLVSCAALDGIYRRLTYSAW